MNDTTNWKVPKWPFLIGDGLLIVFGFVVVRHSPLPGHWAVIAAGSVVLGSILGVIPYLLDYRVASRALEVNALGAVADRIQNLEKLATQISAATSQWAGVQEAIGGQAEKTTLAAKAIADRMTSELVQFSEFMKKANDTEKTALRLEVDKLHRAEADWLQVLVRILDHVFALHAGAVRTGEAKFAAPVGDFQNACRDAARRIGLAPFEAAAGEPFSAERHQAAGSKEPPPAAAVVAETVGAGYTYQGRLLRPALVRLRDANPPVEAPAAKPVATPKPAPAPKPAVVSKPAPAKSPAPADEEAQLPFESPD